MFHTESQRYKDQLSFCLRTFVWKINYYIHATVSKLLIIEVPSSYNPFWLSWIKG